MQYQSPFGTRYGSSDLSNIWSETTKRQLWREYWYKLLDRQNQDGLFDQAVPAEQMEIARKVLLGKYMPESLLESMKLEKTVRHDLVAELQTAQAELLAEGFENPGYLHMGATSSDVEDYADSMRIYLSLVLLKPDLLELARQMARSADAYASLYTSGFTHLQQAEPTTLGYRFAVYADAYMRSIVNLLNSEYNDTWTHAGDLDVGGAVGVSSNLQQLCQDQGLDWQAIREHYLNGGVRLQTLPRVDEVILAGNMAAVAAWLNKIALDIRIMQGFGLLQEGKGKSQVGSSAMPGKSNPIKCENTCSLARHIKSLYLEAWDYASLSMLERTLDDSAARRYVLPELFLALQQMLHNMTEVFQGMEVNVGLNEHYATTSRRVWVPSRVYAQMKAAGLNPSQEQAVQTSKVPGKWSPSMQLDEAVQMARSISKDVLAEVKNMRGPHAD
jgi:adenylosuccinate lyase